jgi:hypothetical protein
VPVVETLGDELARNRTAIVQLAVAGHIEGS